MSEAAPGFPDSLAYVSPERARLAAALRALIDTAMTMPDATSEQLVDAAARVEGVVASLAGVVDRTIAAGYSPRAHADYLPRSPAIGAASPLSPGTIEWDVVDDADRADVPYNKCVVATGAMPAAYEGPPSFVHGGVIALMFDELLGVANIANGCPGMTGTLTIKYRRPTPLFQPLRWTAWVERVEGRRIRSRAEVSVGDELCAEADGIFVQPSEWRRRAYFGDQQPE
jgi:acyl-coenzyme A thioesterase PaaI-like protein